MATDPWSGARYPAESDSGDVALWMQRAVNDLSAKVPPKFPNATARDNAASAAVTAGTLTLSDGLMCFVGAQPQLRVSGAWRALAPRLGYRYYTPAGQFIGSGGNRQSGTGADASITSWTAYVAGRISLTAEFRVGPATTGSGAALCYIYVDGVSKATGVQRSADTSTTLTTSADISAGAHTISLRVEAFGGDVNWVDAYITIVEGVAE